MNKLEVCLTESEEKTNSMIADSKAAVEVKVVASLSGSRDMCVEYFKIALYALEQVDEDVFMDALELYLKEKSDE